MKNAVLFSIFRQTCPFFLTDNQCTHQNQENVDYDEDLEKDIGYCTCSGCPLGYKADLEDFNDEDIDWDTVQIDDIETDEYLIVDNKELTANDEKIALSKYNNYINKYN